MTGDHLPKIVWLGERALSVFGFSGRGIAPGTVFGKALADFLVSGDPAVLPVAPIEVHRELLAGAKQVYYEFGASLLHAIDCR